MPLPSEFDDVEHFQSVCRDYVNRLIREDFKDLGDATWVPDVSTSRGAMRQALTHKDNDSLIITNSRLLLYYMVYGKCKKLQGDIFGIPKTSFDVERKYKPTVTLYFRQNRDDVAAGEQAVKGEISFRLMNESATTITQAEVNRLALNIKNEFAVPSLCVWHKGRLMATYSDWNNGYQFQLLSSNTADAKALITKVLKIQNHTPDWKFMNNNDNADPLSAYPSTPGTEMILGKNRDKIKPRPVVNVKFRYATLSLRGNKPSINLVDTTGRRRNPIETA